jgi:hypothetical protein
LHLKVERVATTVRFKSVQFAACTPAVGVAAIATASLENAGAFIVTETFRGPAGGL